MNEKKLSLVQEMLDLSGQYSLRAEVVLTAIKLAKQYPDASIASIVNESLSTWDCFPEIEVENDLPF